MNIDFVCPPVMICGFNRPDNLRQVFEAVRKIRPRRLFLVLDAARDGRSGEAEKVNACKEIFAQVDWECEVTRDYAEKNLGCRNRMASGISNMFAQVDRAIILEDDCVPDETFFPFCAELLERYKDDTRIGMISGHIEPQSQIETFGASYYYNRLGIIIGWATWRRAWLKNNAEMTDWPNLKKQDWLYRLFGKRRYVRDWNKIMDRVYEHRVSSWATAWALTMFREHFLCIHPKVNLITNIGFGADGTHTTCSVSPWANVPLSPMDFPLIHPATMIPDVDSERQAQDNQYSLPWLKRLPIVVKGLPRRLLNVFSRGHVRQG